jgi:hypothetical protein
MDSLFALSFLQPWLWAILEGHKGFRLDGSFIAIENRTWKPPARFVGRRFALHASAGWDADGEEFIDETSFAIGVPFEAPPKTHCTRSAIVGTAQLVGAFNVLFDRADPRVRNVGVSNVVGDPSRGALDLVGSSPWSFGPWCWLLSDVRKLREPIPAKGRLGLWSVPDEIAARVRELEAA